MRRAWNRAACGRIWSACVDIRPSPKTDVLFVCLFVCLGLSQPPKPCQSVCLYAMRFVWRALLYNKTYMNVIFRPLNGHYYLSMALSIVRMVTLVGSWFRDKPRPHQQQFQSNVWLCRSNVRFRRKNRSTWNIRQRCFDIVAGVDGALKL